VAGLAVAALFAAGCASDGGRRAGADRRDEPASSSPDAAVVRSYVEELANFDAEQQFDVPGLSGAVGVRLSVVDYLLIQPAGEPPFSDRIYFVAGDVGVRVAVNQDEPDAGTRAAADIALQVAGLAG